MARLAEETLLAYTGDRADVVAMFSRQPRAVLDVGCSDGSLLAALGADVETVGIELDPHLAASARGRVGEVLESDALEGVSGLRAAGRKFDLVICADILEHLTRPDLVVNEVAAILTPDGEMVISLPNVRFWTTFWWLGMRGSWPRRSRGVHDHTHLRWFTDADARSMFADAGLAVEAHSQNCRFYDDPMKRGNRLAKHFARGPLRPFLTYQNLYRLRSGD